MSLIKNRQLFALALGHFGTDLYPNILPMLYPLLMSTMGLSYMMVGLLQLVYTAVSSLLQPVLGLVADRSGSRYLAPASVMVLGLFMGLLGLAWDYWSLAALLCLAAIGVAAYHPQAASSTAATTTPEHRATAMSIYMFGGNAGYALGPLLGAAILASPLGLRTTLLLPIPSALIALLLLRLTRSVDRPRREMHTERKSEEAHGSSRNAIGSLSTLLGVVLLRCWTYGTLIAFIPLWYDAKGLPPSVSSGVLVTMLLSGAVGGIIGGVLADRFGRRRIVTGGIALAIPALLLFLNSGVVWAFPAAILVGLAFGGNYSVMLVMAQEMLPRSMGLASGLVLGFAFVTGGIGAAVTGSLADSYGLANALTSTVLVLVLALALCFALPRERGDLAGRGATATT